MTPWNSVRALAIFEKALGPQHPKSAACVQNYEAEEVMSETVYGGSLCPPRISSPVPLWGRA
jgi:hypothetical protein